MCGHGRVAAARQLGLARIPVIRAADLTETQIRALMIADNRLTELGGWDDTLLAEHLRELDALNLDFDIEHLGFDYGEIEQRLLALEDLNDHANHDASAADELPPEDAVPRVTRPGDLWLLEDRDGTQHRLLCADATRADAYNTLMHGGVHR